MLNMLNFLSKLFYVYSAYLHLSQTQSVCIGSERKRIGILVMNTAATGSKYEQNLASLECYAASHNYSLRVIEQTEEFPQCEKYNAWWARHCFLIEVMKEADWWLMLDADVVIVQDKCLEDYIADAPLSTSVILQQRYHKNSICACLYLIKNSREGLEFLKRWLSYASISHDDNVSLWHFLVSLARSTPRPSRLQGAPWQVMAPIHGYVSPDVVVLPSFNGLMRDASLTDPRVWLEQHQGAAMIKAGLNDTTKQHVLPTDFILHGIKGTRMLPLLDHAGQWPNMTCDPGKYAIDIPKSWQTLDYQQSVAVVDIARASDERRYGHVATAWHGMNHSQCWPQCKANIFPIYTTSADGTLYVHDRRAEKVAPPLIDEH
eukprot:TRINITY_DN8499_c0_g1_i1.p1 TRINITY_DN8499_c0_g1~~TRINITY_DN8499_c0_g1_i1.p1  ORF type:complete len:375 (+),score=32.34 TRINITY_DN8499_c0_g1_i1:831-1955(+)